MQTMGRRMVLAGFLATGALALPGCTTIGKPSYTDIIENLLMLSSQRAFARLTQPDGFWDSSVARINLPVLFGRPGSVAQKVFRSPLFKEKLQHELNRIAEDGARVAAPIVYDAVRSLTVTDALALLRGGDTSATTFLRQSMGSGLVNAMIPELDRVMRMAEDPILNTAVNALTGVNMADAAHALALEADNAIWYEIGAQEADIRAHPESTNDGALIAALKLAKGI
jgi:hypothetical protein